MRNGLCVAVLGVLMGGASSVALGAEGTGRVDLPRYPSISPDGKTIVFTWRGDLWSVGSAGGHATRITNHPSNDLHSAWSTDGKTIAFTSERAGGLNIYLMNPDGSNVRQVTDTDRNCALSAFTPDGKSVLFSSSREGDVYRAVRPYKVSIDGGPLTRLLDVFADSPMYSPDGRHIAMDRGGANWARTGYRGADQRELWVYDTRNNAFTQMTTREGNDGQPRWKDNSTIIFLSDRADDTLNLFEVKLGQADANARRLTEFAGTDVDAFDVSADGSTAILLAWDTLYTLDLKRNGAKAKALVITATQDDRDSFALKNISSEISESALSPDGKVLAAVAYGEIYVRNVEEDSPTRRIEMGESRERELAWSPDGLTLYFVSDKDGTDSIYAATVAKTREELKKAVMPKTEEEPAADEEASNAEEAEDDAEEAEEQAADDEKAEEDKNGEDKEEKKDAKKKKKENPADRWHDAILFAVQPVVTSVFNDRDPAVSPDGKYLAFRRTRGDLMLLDLETKELHPFIESWDFGTHFAWAPNSKAIAYATDDMDYNTDIWIAPIDNPSGAVNLTQHPDNDFGMRFSADGRILTFVSTRINDEADVWMVYLDRDVESLAERDLEKYYKDAAERAKKAKPPEPKPSADEAKEDGAEKSTEDENGKKDEKKDDADESSPFAKVAELEELELDDAYLRLRRITSLVGDESDAEVTPAGDKYIFNASDTDGTDASNERGLYVVEWDGKERKRLGDGANVQHVSLTGEKIVTVSRGRTSLVPVAGGKSEGIDYADTMRIDLGQQSGQKFLEASRFLGDGFYHNEMKGLDWPAITKRYHDLALRARTNDEFQYIGARFIGRLNASHLGITPPNDDAPNAQANGRLGIDDEPVDGGFRVKRVLPQGPSWDGLMALKEGDIITAIEMKPFGPSDTIESRLNGRIGQETIVTVRRGPEAGGEPQELQLLITPISYNEEVTLRYNAWQRENAKKVEEWSNGRLGYLHIRAMGLPDLYEFERDLYAAANGKDGLLIDVRNNGGGWTADFVLASLMVKPHAYTIPRGGDPDRLGHYPRERLFIQRYVKPVNMLCNEKSFSNAEIISHAFKTLGRGTLVGIETNGSVISTGGGSLIDGTWVRLPFRGWYLPDGTDMEVTGAVPDLIVPQTPEDEVRGFDAQLKAAVDDLLKRIG